MYNDFDFFYSGDQAFKFNNGIKQENMVPRTHSGDDSLTNGSSFQLGAGINAPLLDVATPAVFMPAVIVVTSIPAMYMKGSMPTDFGVLLKELMESHAKSVSGLDISYTLDSAGDSPVGHDGQNMAVPGKTKRSQPSPSFSFQELSSNLVWNTFNKWVWDINHPDSYQSMANVGFPGSWSMSVYSMTMFAIQFDPTMLPDRIIDAVAYTNMWPQGAGELGIERNIGQAQTRERSITFSAIAHHNPYIKILAKHIAEKLCLHKVNFDMAPPNRSTMDPGLDANGISGEAGDRTLWPSMAGNVPSDHFTEGVQNPSIPQSKQYAEFNSGKDNTPTD